MFYDNEFDRIWDSIIERSIKNHSEMLGVSYKNLPWVKLCMRHKFNKYKDVLVKNYMVLDTFNIDRHKIAACMMKAILNVKPLYIPYCAKLKFLFSSKDRYFDSILDYKLELNEDDENSPKKYYLFLNEYLSLGIAISILDSYIKTDNNPNRFVHNIVLPNPFPVPDEDYLLDVCIGLHYTQPSTINPIAYANAFFLWEKYSCRKKQCDNIESSYKELLKKSGAGDEQKIKNMARNARYGLKDN